MTDRAPYGLRRREVYAAFTVNPTWSSADIAAAIGCRSEYVRATLARMRLKLLRFQGEHGAKADARVKRVVEIRAAVDAGW